MDLSPFISLPDNMSGPTSNTSLENNSTFLVFGHEQTTSQLKGDHKERVLKLV